MDWRYERGEGRHKHRWKNDWAGFEPSGNGPVGKCPKSINQERAQEILNQGKPWYEDIEDEFPSRIYCQYKGVVYEAVPTRPGASWHAYPWRGDLSGKAPLPSRIRRALEKEARKAGHLNEFKIWMKKYS